MPIQNVSMLSPYQADQDKIDRQRMMAQMLQQQSMQPIEGASSGGIQAPVSPFQGLAKMLQAYSANKGLEQADARQAELGQQYQQKLSKALDDYQRGMQPIPGQPDVPARDERPYSPGAMQSMPLGSSPSNIGLAQALMAPAAPAQAGTPDTQPNRIAALDPLRSSGIPELQQFAMQQMAMEPELKLRETALQREQERYDTTRADQLDQFKRTEDFNNRKLESDKDLKLALAKLRGSGAAQSPFFNFLPSENGYVVGNARTGELSPAMIGGQPVIRASDSPALQGKIAGAKESGKVSGKSEAQAQIDLPQAIDTANMAIQQIDDLLKHPGFSSAVGATLKPFASRVHGTPEADFTARLDQLKGGAFLQAFETLKGGGQITEVEGKKATDAITRMDKAQSEKEFTAAAREFQDVIRKGVERSKIKAGNPAAPSQTTGGWSIRALP